MANKAEEKKVGILPVEPQVTPETKPAPMEEIPAKAEGEIVLEKGGVYTMNQTVKFNGTLYPRDSKVKATQACAELFLREGYMQ